jgi:hypothetical protein
MPDRTKAAYARLCLAGIGDCPFGNCRPRSGWPGTGQGIRREGWCEGVSEDHRTSVIVACQHWPGFSQSRRSCYQLSWAMVS